MFNSGIGSFEVLLIFIIALLVIGPDKLPAAVRTAGLWMGRFRRSFYKVKAEIERELNADEIKRQLHNETILAEIEDTKSTIEGIAKDAEKSVSNLVNSQDFDPGASKDAKPGDSSDKTQGEKSIVEEFKEAGDQLDNVAKQLYGSGKNPKLAPGDEPIESDEPSDSGKPAAAVAVAVAVAVEEATDQEDSKQENGIS